MCGISGGYTPNEEQPQTIPAFPGAHLATTSGFDRRRTGALACSRLTAAVIPTGARDRLKS
jgi:hypothetical protein